MTPAARAWLLLALCPAFSWAGPKAVELEIPSLGSGVQPTVPLAGLDVGALPQNQGLTALPASVNLGATTAALPQTAVLPVSQAAAMPATAQPQAQAVEGISAGRDQGVEQASHEAGVRFENAASQAKALVVDAPQAAGSLEALVARAASRPLRGVFVQNEQEGTHLRPDPRDSSGNVFRWYRPVEMRPELVAAVEGEMGSAGKLLYGVKRALSRKGDYSSWNAWSTHSRLAYLDKLEKAVVAEKGAKAAWDGKISLLLEKTDDAPHWAAKNPHMEAAPSGYEGAVGAKFLQPEIVSAKDSPALSVNEALGRTSRVIAETGHAGTQYHVFMKLDPETAGRQLASLQGTLELFNDVLFAKAAAGSFENIGHASLTPWHAGRSRRIAQLLRQARAGANVPAAEDPDSEKHAFVGFRYWGLEDGKLVVSLELRSATPDFKARKQSAVRGADMPVQLPERDYAQAKTSLTSLALYAEKLSQGRAPRVEALGVELDARAVDALLRGRARAQGLPDGAYYGIEEFARRLSGGPRAPPGFLFPFAADPGSPAALALADAVVRHAARAKALDSKPGAFEDQKRTIQYEFWRDYAAWAQSFGERRQRDLERLFRAVAVD